MAERLGNGLQNRVQQFKSAWHLYQQRKNPLPDFFVAFKWVGGRTNCKNQGGV